MEGGPVSEWIEGMEAADLARAEEKDRTRYNPRGQKRPQDGKGKGEGMPGGRRGGKNTEPCPDGGVGHGKGGGRGGGKNRKK